MPEPDAAAWADIDAALAAGNLMAALLRYRTLTGAGIGPARVLLEARSAALVRPAPAPPADAAVPEAVQRYLDSGHARPGTLLGWWRNRRGDWNVLVAPASTPGQLEIGVFPPDHGAWGHALNGYLLGIPQWRALLEAQGEPPSTDLGADGPALRTRLAQAIAALPGAPVASLPRPAPARALSLGKGLIAALAAAPFERDWLFLPRPLTDPPSLAARVLQHPASREAWEEEAQGELLAALSGTALSQAVLSALLHLVLAECAEDKHQVYSVDVLFADLAAGPPRFAPADGALTQAFALWLAIADPNGQRRPQLPWWLRDAANARACAGLLSPPEVRELARWLDPLLAALAGAAGGTHGGTDQRAIADLVRRAAAAGHWILGWEPSS